MSKTGRNSLVSAVLFVLLLLAVVTVSAVTPPDEVWVFPGEEAEGYDQDNTAHFLTIQDGINAVKAGGTVNVAAGTYVEEGQIVIGKNLIITGADKDTTIIKPAQHTGDSDDYRGWFLVETGNNFNLSNVTLDGDDKNIYQAIRSHGTVTIENIIIKDIFHPENEGAGVKAFNNITVSDSTFNDIGLAGIYVSGAGAASVQFTGNTFTGNGEGDRLNYAIKIDGVGKAIITGNTISGHLGAGGTNGSESAGVIVVGSEAVITGNTITGNSNGILVGYDDTDDSTVDANQNSISGNTAYGIKKNSTLSTVDADANWWGDPSGPERNPQGEGDKVSEGIEYDPWYIDAAMTQLSDEVNVVVKIHGNGTVTGQQESYEIEDEVTLIATAGANHTFIGWYSGADKIGDDDSYKFEVTEDITIDAVFFWWTNYSQKTDASLTQNANAAFHFYNGNVAFYYNPATKNADGVLAVTLYGIDSDRGVPSSLYSMGLFIHIQCTPDLEGIPVQVVVKYDPTKIPEDMEESSLRLYRYNETTKRWVPVTNQSVDTANKVIRAQLTGFSTYAVFVGELPDTGTLMIYVAAAGAALLLAGLLVSTKKKAAGI